MTTTLPEGGPASAEDRDRLDAFLAARRRGVDWLLARLRPDGALGDPADGYKTYRALWALGLAGEVEAAHRVAGWYRRNALLADGRIGGPFRTQLDGWAYRDSAMIVGGQLIGAYDLGIALLPELRRSQDPVSGGFANDRTADGSLSDDMDIPYACGPGFALLACGDMDGARTVARVPAHDPRCAVGAPGPLPCVLVALPPATDHAAPTRTSGRTWWSTTTRTGCSAGRSAASRRASCAGCSSPIPTPRTSSSRGTTRRSRWPRRTRSSSTRRCASRAGARRCSTR